MNPNIKRLQVNSVCHVTELIYTLSITSRENKFRSNMKRLREMIHEGSVDPSSFHITTLSSCLWFAVVDQDVKSVREMMKYKPNVDLTRSDLNMLWMALIRNDTEIAKMLIEGGANFNVRIPEDGPTFLHFLATAEDDKDSFQLAKLMMERGADINAIAGGCSVLQTAVIHRSVPLVEELLKRGARFKGVDIIILAARSSKASQLLPMIVNAITDTQLRLGWIFSAMQFFIEKEDNKVQSMKALMDVGLPVLKLDIDGWTILRIAIYLNKLDIMKLLLEHGANVNQQSGKSGEFPLFWAASSKRSATTEFLLKNGADIHKHSNIKRYAIHGACKTGSADNINLLLRSGANINVTDKYGNTPFSLMKADHLSESHRAVIKHLASLVSLDSDVNEADLQKIRERPKMLLYYDDCLKHLKSNNS